MKRLSFLACLMVASSPALAQSMEAEGAQPDAQLASQDVQAHGHHKKKHHKKKHKKGSRAPEVSGFIQAFYRYAFATGEDGVVDNDNFRVQRVRLKFKGKVVRKVRYVVEVDPRAPEVTGIMRDAYISLHHLPHHELRIGQQKTQFGYESRTSSTRLYAVNRSELSDALARGVTQRDIGLGLLGKWPLGKGFRLEDAITLVNGSGMNVQNDATDKMSVWGRVGARYKREDLKIWLGFSGGYGDYIDTGDLDQDPADDFRLEFKRLGTDLRVDHPWFFASAELAVGTDLAVGESEDVSGYYLNLVGKTPWRVGPIARVDTYLDEFRRWTFGAYYGLADEKLRLLLNYEYREVFNDARGDDKLYLWMQARF